MSDAKHLTDRQALALHILAIVEEVSFAEIRRRAMTDAAESALADPTIAAIVRDALRYRRKQTGHVLRLVVNP